jgi:assimilatory nitrate reductase catalytic subunit
VWGIDADDIPGAGRSAYEMLDAMGTDDGIRALLLVGSNPVVSAPNAMHIEERFRALDLLVVADFFLSETAQHAHVVLPSAQWAEEEGTMTNLEGRVILRRRAVDAPADVRNDLDILTAVAARLGKERHFCYSSTSDVFDELCRASAGGPADYSGMSWEKIEASGGVFWPCPSPDHPGTPRIFAERFATPTGRARFHAVRHLAPAEEPDRDYPLFLTTGRVLAHYQSGTQTRRVDRLVDMAPEPFAEISPAAAKRAGIADGVLLALVTRRGRAVARARITRGIRDDTVFVPFHWAGMASINRLTNPALDPTSRMPEFKVCAVRLESHPESRLDS